MARSKASLRKKVKSALASAESADEVLDAIVALQEAYNALLLRLDGDGTLADDQWTANLQSEVLDPDEEG